MRNLGFLENWHPSLSRADLLSGGHAQNMVSRVVTAATIMLAPVVAVGVVCAAFQFLTKFV